MLNDRPPVISYKYPQTISRKILNHRKTVKDIDFDLGSSSMTCSCCDSGFQNKDVGHMVTGDLRIVKDTDDYENCWKKNRRIENLPKLTGRRT